MTRRGALHRISATVGARLVFFCIVDDHLHVLVFCARPEAGRLGSALLFALRPIAPRVESPHVREVKTRNHLDWLVDYYFLTQPVKHGLPDHPALYEGSCFQEICGARAIPGMKLHVGQALPRYRYRRAYPAVGLQAEEVQPMEDAGIGGLGVARLLAATEIALAAPPGLLGNDPLQAIGRRAVIQLGMAAGLGTGACALALDVTRATVGRLRHRPIDVAVERAIRVRLALEERVLASPVMASLRTRDGTVEARVSPPSSRTES